MNQVGSEVYLALQELACEHEMEYRLGLCIPKLVVLDSICVVSYENC